LIRAQFSEGVRTAFGWGEEEVIDHLSREEILAPGNDPLDSPEFYSLPT
jgi:hypothetical protein